MNLLFICNSLNFTNLIQTIDIKAIIIYNKKAY